MLDEALKEWLARGQTGTLASLGADLEPHLTRIWAARPAARDDEIELFVLSSDAGQLLEDLDARPFVAANIIEPPTYRSLLFKGPASVLGDQIKPEGIDSMLTAVDQGFERVGLAAGAGALMRARYASLDSYTHLLMRVVEIYDQSPRPGAGGRLR